MFQGTVVSIHIGPKKNGPMQSVESVRAIPGKGLEGDRFALLAASLFGRTKPSRELTLIESESIEALSRDFHIELAPGESRRNVMTRGVPLNDLVGYEFYVGDVLCRGIQLCEPCSHLERLTGKKVIQGLRHRGGLRAQILNEAAFHAGDKVRLK
jgi:MOSC domain-containing protein YiiM